MELLVTLGRTLGFSFAAGVNLYATVAILGLASRFHWVSLPPQFAVFDSNWVIGIAMVCYAIEFVADKVPWVDTAWDAVHTVIRRSAAPSSRSPRSATCRPGRRPRRHCSAAVWRRPRT